MKKMSVLFLALLCLALVMMTSIPAFAEDAQEAAPEAADVTSLIEKARRTGTVLTVCSQCPQATVNMNAYEAGHALAAAGAVSGGDMTTEAAVAKLYYLFTVSDDTEEIRKMMEMNLRGERR